MRTGLRTVFIGLVGAGAAWWLLTRTRSPGTVRGQQCDRPHREWPPMQPTDFWLDGTIEDSFPASDPPSSTPIMGTGWSRK